ncbi:MAG: DUF3500 domain-containing protein [Paracoccaceae bacterium]|nr:DUF3500 domain-containing protein [Paracoccaceae bacterium]
MKSSLAAGTILISALALPCSAHEARDHEHAELVPIPEYHLPFGEAGAAASLQAAEAFLASLDEAIRAQIMFDLDAEERAGWSNLPAGSFPRAGISVGELSDDQRKLLFDFLASSLSEEGYRRVKAVMAAEAYLNGLRSSAARRKIAPEYYWISFYGTPSATSPWGWQFGGHHLGLNLSLESNRVTAMSPSFVGTEPTVFTHNGVEYESVVDMHRAGHALYAALNTAQQAAARGRFRVGPGEVRTGPGRDGYIPETIGLSAAEMTARQKALLLAAIDRWVSIQPSENAVRRMAELEADLDRLYFAWSGSDKINRRAYMRIQGPTLIIELVSTGGDLGHYHTIYRNPTSEYGGLGP